MLSHLTSGAVLFSDVGLNALLEACEVIAKGLGYTDDDDDPADFEIMTYEGAGGVCIAFGGQPSLARFFGHRVAQRLGREVRVLTATLTDRGDDDFECALGDIRIGRDGTSGAGPWADELATRCHGDWGSLCDGKAYLAVTACLDDAVATVLADAAERGSLLFRTPAPLGSARLDDLAMKARLADQVELTHVGGRVCLRVKMGEETITSFVDAAEAKVLKEAIAVLA